MKLFEDSNLDEILQDTLLINGKQYSIYGDAAYSQRPPLQIAFPRNNATTVQRIYNTRISALREAVEWSYKDIKQIWSSQDYKRGLKVRKAPIALMYKAAALLNNFKTCIYRVGQVGMYFMTLPPSLDEFVTSN